MVVCSGNLNGFGFAEFGAGVLERLSYHPSISSLSEFREGEEFKLLIGTKFFGGDTSITVIYPSSFDIGIGFVEFTNCYENCIFIERIDFQKY
jgi:hypothetical protein